MNPDDIVLDLSQCTSITAPRDPNIGDIWLDTSSMTTNVYTDSYDWITITGDSGSIDLNNITIVEPVEFEDQMPSVAKIEDMCKEYPGLEKAYENFKTVYKMVHQHWRGKQDAEQDGLF
jgi:hypothetical protein